jgi:hypothetical protein
MKFIERGVNGRDNKAHGKSASDSRLTLTKRPEKKGGDNRVFAEVSALADDELD